MSYMTDEIKEIPELSRELRSDLTQISDEVLRILAEEEVRILEQVCIAGFESIRRTGKLQPIGTGFADIEGEQKRQAAIRLVESWLNDTSGYDSQVWPQLSRDIEEHRLSDRKRLSG